MYSRNIQIGAAYKVLWVPPDSVLQISLLSAPSTRFDHRHKGPHFAVLPLGLENLTAALIEGNIQ